MHISILILSYSCARLLNTVFAALPAGAPRQGCVFAVKKPAMIINHCTGQ
jgi:hypothetical protein